MRERQIRVEFSGPTKAHYSCFLTQNSSQTRSLSQDCWFFLNVSNTLNIFITLTCGFIPKIRQMIWDYWERENKGAFLDLLSWSVLQKNLSWEKRGLSLNAQIRHGFSDTSVRTAQMTNEESRFNFTQRNRNGGARERKQIQLMENSLMINKSFFFNSMQFNNKCYTWTMAKN